MKLSADLYHQALRFAGRAHDGQLMPGAKLPYLVHLGGVAGEVIAAALAAAAGDEPFDLELAAVAALLHDTVEDTAVRIEDVEREFGPRVAEVVLALTKDAKLPKAAQMADSLARIAALPGELGRAAAIVKLSDRATNLQAPPAYWTREKRLSYQAEARLILQTLAPVSRLAPLEKRLAEKIEGYTQYLGS